MVLLTLKGGCPQSRRIAISHTCYCAIDRNVQKKDESVPFNDGDAVQPHSLVLILRHNAHFHIAQKLCRSCAYLQHAAVIFVPAGSIGPLGDQGIQEQASRLRSQECSPISDLGA